MRLRRLLIVALAGVALGLSSLLAYRTITTPRRTTRVYDPPVLAGQQLWGYCAGGVYARRGDRVVLTSTGHCTTEGTVAYDPDGVTRRVGAPQRHRHGHRWLQDAGADNARARLR